MSDKPLSTAPFSTDVGVELESAADGTAVATLSLEAGHSMRSDAVVAHGGVVFTLADVAAAAAVNSLGEKPSPTMDMRVDFLEPATSDLRATATVDRTARTFAFVSIHVDDADGEAVAKADGIFKR